MIDRPSADLHQSSLSPLASNCFKIHKLILVTRFLCPMQEAHPLIALTARTIMGCWTLTSVKFERHRFENSNLRTE